MDSAPIAGKFYIRHFLSADTVSRLIQFGPKTRQLATGHRCPACDQYILEGDYTTLVPIGPGEDAEERAKARAGAIYNAVAIEVHWSCATGQNP